MSNVSSNITFLYGDTNLVLVAYNTWMLPFDLSRVYICIVGKITQYPCSCSETLRFNCLTYVDVHRTS